LAKKNNDGGLFERFLIIIFGAAIVLLGAYPLTREYGGVTNYLQSKGSQLSSYLDQKGDGTTRRGQLSSGLPPAQKKRVSDLNRNTKRTVDEKPMDDLTVDDRKELDNLLQSVVN
jgi:hypothetical protein